MAISKAVKKEPSNKFVPVEDVPYQVQILGFAELGTEEKVPYAEKDNPEADTEAVEQIGIVLHFIGYTEDDGSEEGIYVSADKKVKGKSEPRIETWVKKMNTGAKSALGAILDAAGKDVRDKDGNVDPRKAVGKLITMTYAEEKMFGEMKLQWKPTRMSLAEKKLVEKNDDLPKFLFDLMEDDTTPAQGFDEDFDAEFPEFSYKMLLSTIMRSTEFADFIEGEDCYMSELLEEWNQEYGTFDSEPSKKKKATRKAPAKKAAEKKEEEPEVDSEEDEAEALAAAKAKKAAEKKAKAKADKEAAKRAFFGGNDDDDDDEEAEALAALEAAKKAKAAKKAAKAKAKAQEEAKAAEDGDDDDDEEPF